MYTRTGRGAKPPSARRWQGQGRQHFPEPSWRRIFTCQLRNTHTQHLPQYSVIFFFILLIKHRQAPVRAGAGAPAAIAAARRRGRPGPCCWRRRAAAARAAGRPAGTPGRGGPWPRDMPRGAAPARCASHPSTGAVAGTIWAWLRARPGAGTGPAEGAPRRGVQVVAGSNPWETLGVAETADEPEVKRAYRKLALKCAPTAARSGWTALQAT